MKLPSVRQVSDEALATVKRFPFVLLSAFIGTTAMVILIEDSGTHALYKAVLASALGLPLFTSIAIAAEKRKWDSLASLGINIGAAVTLIAYGILLPEDVFDAPSFHLVRFFVLNVGLHMLVSFAPFSSRGELMGFWQFNKALFLRFLTAVLFSGVLYAGLAIAIASVDQLFDVNIDGDLYGQLWVVIAGLFNTWFFLAGVPSNLQELDSETGYPKGLKIFTQYILIPLVVIYLLILYAYMGKILIEWNWPKGWVSNLVLGFSITGILSFLLLWPIQERTENMWIKTFARWFYRALVPLVVMLLLAIGLRLSDYGFTENRYYVLLMGLWLSGIVLYFIISKVKSIKVIPLSLCLIAFLSTYGLWSASSVSERSQLSRLDAILSANKMFSEGLIVPPETKPSHQDMKEISSIVKYVHDTHGTGSLQPYFSADLDSLKEQPSRSLVSKWERPKYIVRLMGIPYIEGWQSDAGQHFTLGTNQLLQLDVSGYEHLFQQLNFSRWDSTEQKEIGGETYVVECSRVANSLLVMRLSDSVSVTLHLAPIIDKVLDGEFPVTSVFNLQPDRMVVIGEEHLLKVQAIVTNVNGKKTEAGIAIDNIGCTVLVGSNR